jgi:hypothetical protein
LSFDKQPNNVRIHHNTLKQYYGNGTFVGSGGGGTQSRFCLAAIDVVGLNVHDNTLYGSVDLEPNNAEEHLIDVSISSNKFKSGHVTAQGTIGTDYWHDEPVNYSGNSTIPQVVALTSIASAPIVSNLKACNNSFEFGTINADGGAKKWDLIAGNIFEVGHIRPAFAATTARTKIIDNIAYEPISANDIFIEIERSVSHFEVGGNSARGSGWASCVGFSGSGADGGNNLWGPNTAESGVATNLTPHATSQACGVPLRLAFTPVATFATAGDLSVVYAANGQLGEIVILGKTAKASFRLVLTTFMHSTASGNLRITGLPYTSRNSVIAYEGSVRWQGITKASYTDVIAKVEPNVAYIDFEASGSGQARSAVTAADMPSGGTVELIGTVTYELP